MDFCDITALKQSCDLFRLLAIGPGGGNWAGLGGEGEGDLVAVGLAEDDLALLDGVGAVFELGDVEALLLFDVTADNFGDLDGLGHAVPDGLGSGNINADDEGGVDQGDGVLLGLVLFLAVLVFASVGVGAAVAGSVARGDSHALGAGLGGHLQNQIIKKLFILNFLFHRSWQRFDLCYYLDLYFLLKIVFFKIKVDICFR